MRKIILITLCALLFVSLHAQDRFVAVEAKLKELAVKDALGLNEKVELSVNGVALNEFIRGIAVSNSVNVSMDPALNEKIYNNFTNVNVADVFLFLSKKFDLDMTFIGNIISFTKHIETKPEPPKYAQKQINISFDKNTGFVSIDLNNDSLQLVAKELTRVAQKNVVFSPELNGKIVNGFIQNVSFDNAMDKLAFSNDLKITKSDDDFYLIEKRDKDLLASKNGLIPKNNQSDVQGLSIKRDNNYMTVDATNVPISDIINMASAEMGKDYYLFTELKGNSTVKINHVTYDELLTNVLNGTDFTYKKQDDVYLFGDRNLEGLRKTKLVQLKYRTAEKITDFIPGDLKKGVDIKIFPDLNGIILSGSQPRIDEIEKFLMQVDRVVPVVVIQVMIANVSKSKTLSTGIEAGLGKSPKATEGTVFPGLDLTFSSSALNELIDGINGYGVVNLGNVTPNFYLSLKAMESQGVLKLRSTPQLATLNGNKATMSIGETQYYLEVTNNVIGTQNPQNQLSQTYKSVNADLSLTITPVVSGDEQITLDIAVKQSSFTARISNTAPPGQITRDFQSLLRVKNGDMVMLGGLEEASANDSGSGVPFLSRIPIIKWFFSSRTRTKSKSKLTIFIKPTVIY